MALSERRLLTVNTGSSSLKAAVYRYGDGPRLELRATAGRIGRPDGGALRVTDAAGAALLTEERPLPDHAAALAAFLAWLGQERTDLPLAAVGHRLVHGGAAYRAPVLLTPAVVADIRRLIPIDPNHLPQALAAVAAVGRTFPDLPQVACFDTAFHAGMPRVAHMYALPRALDAAGVRRYGFHGLSYEFIMARLRAIAPDEARGRVVIAHLGNGASMAAVRDGASVDTTMGFTPTGGLVMGTRTGDLDPGVLLYLLQERGLDAAALGDLVNRQAGLLGVSETSADMQDLLAREATDERAAEAVALFCWQARKFLAAMAAALGGLDTLIFTGGIGEHAAPIRARLCAELAFLGIELDAAANAAGAVVISAAGSPATVRVLATDEDLMLARHTARLLWEGAAPDVPL